MAMRGLASRASFRQSSFPVLRSKQTTSNLKGTSGGLPPPNPPGPRPPPPGGCPPPGGPPRPPPGGPPRPPSWARPSSSDDAEVMNTLSFQTMGDDQPRPDILADHATFLSAAQMAGRLA